MMKLMGSLCVFAAGGIAWYLQRREEQRKRLVLAELTAALRQMETEIRLARTALPQLLEQLAEGRCKEVSAFWMSVSRDLTAGRRPLSAWRHALGGLGLSPEDARALLSLPEALQGDETSACKGIFLAQKRCRTVWNRWKPGTPVRKNGQRPCVFPPPRWWWFY